MDLFITNTFYLEAVNEYKLIIKVQEQMSSTLPDVNIFQVVLCITSAQYLS